MEQGPDSTPQPGNYFLFRLTLELDIGLIAGQKRVPLLVQKQSADAIEGIADDPAIRTLIVDHKREN